MISDSHILAEFSKVVVSTFFCFLSHYKYLVTCTFKRKNPKMLVCLINFKVHKRVVPVAIYTMLMFSAHNTVH